jgi:cell shape-determining protein MreC
MAEDFYALFKIGVDNKSISSLDTSGVALAAVQALKKQKDQEIASLRNQNIALTQRLSAMEVQLAEVEELKRQLAALTAMASSHQLAQRVPN